MTVQEVMTKDVATCRPHDTLLEAGRLMLRRRISSLLVVAGDGSGRLVGTLAEVDVCAAAIRSQRPLGEIEVRSALKSAAHLCQPGDLLVDALAVMESTGSRRLPVVDQAAQVVGLISLADIARYEVEDEAGMLAFGSRDVCRALAAASGVAPTG